LRYVGLGVVAGTLVGLLGYSSVEDLSFVRALPIVLGLLNTSFLVSWLMLEPRVKARQFFSVSWCLLMGVIAFFPIGLLVKLMFLGAGVVLWRWDHLDRPWIRRLLAASPAGAAVVGTVAIGLMR